MGPHSFGLNRLERQLRMYRSVPSTVLEGSSASNPDVWYASADMQGWRNIMEDKHQVILNYSHGPGCPTTDYFALFDGHSGANAARYGIWALHHRLFEQDTYLKQYPEALQAAVIMIDKEICTNCHAIRSGCTALVTLVVGDVVHIANVGDSRAVICTAGQAKDLTWAHTTSLEAERDRILKAGGFIKNNRVCGSLAMTRSLGDFRFKKQKTLRPEEQIVVGIPDIISHQIQPEDEFLVLASDGIWDCFSSQEVVDIIRYQISLGATLAQACAFICNTCLAPEPLLRLSPGTDNMTIIVVAFLRGRKETQWMEWITERVEMKVGRATLSTIPQIHGNYVQLQHPAQITTDFSLTLCTPAEPLPPPFFLKS